MDFAITPTLNELSDRTPDFTVEKNLPFESDRQQGLPGSGLGPVTLMPAAGLLTSHASTQCSRLGVTHGEKSPSPRGVGCCVSGYGYLGLSQGKNQFMKAVFPGAQKLRWQISQYFDVAPC